jgi:MFS family permease
MPSCPASLLLSDEVRASARAAGRCPLGTRSAVRDGARRTPVSPRRCGSPQSVFGDSSTIAPGPLLVLPTALLLTERLIRRFGSGVVIAIGASLFAIGALWFALFAGLKPDYFADIIPGNVLLGVGVGLTLPTIVASATSELPPENFATGSAVVNMLRQVGLAIGVAILIAVLGTHSGAHAVLDAFDRSWVVIGAFAVATALASLAILGIHRPAPYSAPTGATVPIDGRVALGEET